MTIYKQVLWQRDWFYIEYIGSLYRMEIFSVGNCFGNCIGIIIGTMIGYKKSIESVSSPSTKKCIDGRKN